MHHRCDGMEAGDALVCSLPSFFPALPFVYMAAAAVAAAIGVTVKIIPKLR